MWTYLTVSYCRECVSQVHNNIPCPQLSRDTRVEWPCPSSILGVGNGSGHALTDCLPCGSWENQRSQAAGAGLGGSPSGMRKLVFDLWLLDGKSSASWTFQEPALCLAKNKQEYKQQLSVYGMHAHINICVQIGRNICTNICQMNELLLWRPDFYYKKSSVWLLVLTSWLKFRMISYSLSNVTEDFFPIIFWPHHSSPKKTVTPVVGVEPLPCSIYLNGCVPTSCQEIWSVTSESVKRMYSF